MKRAINKALHSEGSISRRDVQRWIDQAEDLEVLALLYKLTYEAWDRIEPPLAKEETCALIRRYLLQCIREDPSAGVALTRYEAAGVLEAWFDHLASLAEDTEAILRDSAAAVADLFLKGNDEVRDAIETGFLEHLLEQDRFRPLFEHWANDDRLRGAWQDALAWGEAHPNYMKGIRQQLRSVERETK